MPAKSRSSRIEVQTRGVNRPGHGSGEATDFVEQQAEIPIADAGKDGILRRVLGGLAPLDVGSQTEKDFDSRSFCSSCVP